ncbi:MAG: hypothetical protein KDK39_12030 [Leptospiraceae bacterium]|nr:hypothetical protein [Leptospiraceae bacterium]
MNTEIISGVLTGFLTGSEQMSKSVLITILLILPFIQCNKSEPARQSSNKCAPDLFYKNDVINHDWSKFEYPPVPMPTIGKTTEQELLGMYPKEWYPARIYSFKKDRVLKFRDKSFRFDKYIMYKDYRKKDTISQGSDGRKQFSRVHSDYIRFYVFFRNKAVVALTTYHMTKKGNKWKPGSYSNGYAESLGEAFPGENYINCMYLSEHDNAACKFENVYTEEICLDRLKASRPWR